MNDNPIGLIIKATRFAADKQYMHERLMMLAQIKEDEKKGAKR